MDSMAVVSLATGIGACAGRVFQVWLRGRVAVQLARLSEAGTTDRVKALPAGSLLSEQRDDRSKIAVSVGTAHRPGGANE